MDHTICLRWGIIFLIRQTLGASDIRRLDVAQNRMPRPPRRVRSDHICPNFFYQIRGSVSAFVSVLHLAAPATGLRFRSSYPSPSPSSPPLQCISPRRLLLYLAPPTLASPKPATCTVSIPLILPLTSQVTEQFTNSWKNSQRTGESSSLKETRMYYSPPIFCLLWTNLNALDTSAVSRIAFKSFSALLLISAPNSICPSS